MLYKFKSDNIIFSSKSQGWSQELMNQFKAFYSFECIFHAESEYANEDVNCVKFWKKKLEIWPLVCTWHMYREC